MRRRSWLAVLRPKWNKTSFPTAAMCLFSTLTTLQQSHSYTSTYLLIFFSIILWCTPLISASLDRHSLLHFHLSHMWVHHLHHLHYHRLHLLLLAQCFTLNSRLGSSANPFLHRPFPFLQDWLAYTNSPTIQWFYSAQRLDLFAWCARLSRLLVGFRTHFKSLHFHFISLQLPLPAWHFRCYLEMTRLSICIILL